MRTAFGRRFDVPDGYLNTASIGVPPVDAAAAVAAAVRDWRSAAARPADFDDPVAVARTAFAELIGVPADRVVIGPTVSALVALVAASLPDRARVLVPTGEFTSVSYPFAAQAGRGVRVTESDLETLGERAGGFDLVATSVVQSSDGRVVDLDALRIAREGGTRVLLDASQSAGWFAGDTSWADVVVAHGYKWLLSPRGAAWMAVRPELELVPLHAGWFAAEDRWTGMYGLPMRLVPGAQALDSSPAWFSHVGAAAALPWLAGLDRHAVHAHCTGLADTLRVGLGMEPAGSAIVSVTAPDALSRLAAAGVVGSARAGGARLAFHLYNTADDMLRARDALT